MNNRRLSEIVLAVFLIVYGLIAITNIQIQFAPFVLGGLAIAAGLLYLFGR